MKIRRLLNSKDDLVSVVIPVFNSEKFLKDSIESVLDQTYKNIEIIVVDDGSTDNSLKILHSYRDKIQIISQENKGLAVSLNSGIKAMKGNWFKWFSPDDILLPHAIDFLVNEAKKLSENTIVYSNWELIDETGKTLRSFSESNYNELSPFDFIVRLLDGQQINVNTCIIPSLLFKKGCNIIDLKEPAAIDYDFFLRAAIFYQTKFFLVPKTLLKYRIHSQQLSHKNISKTLSYISELRKEILSQLREAKQLEFLNALEKYKKKKSISKQTLEVGLKIASNVLPTPITDNLLSFYLNKIRRTR